MLPHLARSRPVTLLLGKSGRGKVVGTRRPACRSSAIVGCLGAAYGRLAEGRSIGPEGTEFELEQLERLRANEGIACPRSKAYPLLVF